MSLINDALKRASQTQSTIPPEIPSGLKPATPGARQPGFAPKPGHVILLVAIMAALAAAYLLQKPKEKTTASARQQVAETLSSETGTLTDEAGPVNDSPAAPIFVTPTVAPAAQVPVATVQEPVETAPASSMSAVPVQNPTVLESAQTVSVPIASEQAVVAAVQQTPPAPAQGEEFPALKLQGIYYSVSRPSILINSRILFIGDVIEGVKVAGIERKSVRLEYAGETKVLTVN